MALCTKQVLTHLELIFQWRRLFFSPTFWMGRLSLRVVQKVMNIVQLGSGRASSWICSQWTHYTTAQITRCQERALTLGQGSRLLSSHWSLNIRYKETKLETQARDTQALPNQARDTQALPNQARDTQVLSNQARDTQALSNQARDTQVLAYPFCFWQFFQDLLPLSTQELC